MSVDLTETEMLMMRKGKERHHRGWQEHYIISISLGEEKGRREQRKGGWIEGRTDCDAGFQWKETISKCSHTPQSKFSSSFVVFNLRSYFFLLRALRSEELMLKSDKQHSENKNQWEDYQSVPADRTVWRGDTMNGITKTGVCFSACLLYTVWDFFRDYR